MAEKKEIDVLVGNRIKELLVQNGISQTEFALMTNVAQSHISRYLNGTVSATLSKLQVFCKVLDITLSDLLKGI